MEHCGTDVPAVNGVRCPGTAHGGLLMDHDAGAGRSQGCLIVIESTMDLGPGRKVRVDAGTSQEIQCDQSLGQKLVPKV